MSTLSRGLEPAGRAMFRPEAVRRHARGQEEAVLPRFVSPRTFLYLWLLLGLLGAGTVAAWVLQVPAYDTVPVVICRQHGSWGQVVVVAFVPPTEIAGLRRGQHLFFSLGARQLDRSIVVLDRTMHSPAALQREFGLERSNGLVLSGPAGVALARLQPLPGGLRAGDYVGSVEHGEIEVGSVRGLSLMPFLGQFFGG